MRHRRVPRAVARRATRRRTSCSSRASSPTTSTSLAKLAARTRRCAAVVGFVDQDRDLYNAAAVCADGEVVGTYRKRLLPNNTVFDEARYFTPGDESDPLELYVIGGVKVGISICEDIWSPFGALAEQAAAGAELNININASPFSIGKGAVRERMLATRATDSHCAVVYVNQVGGQDELVFDGASLVFDHEGNLAGPRHPVRRGTADRRRADPAGVPQAAARPAWPRDAGAAADGRGVDVAGRPERPGARHDRPGLRRRSRAVRRARARHPRLLREERLHRRRHRAVGRHRLDDRRLHRRRRARRRARARRVDAVAVLERPLEVRRRAARREPRHRLPHDPDRAVVPGLPRHAGAVVRGPRARASPTRTSRAVAAARR